VTLTEADRTSAHIRPVERMLAEVLARDGRAEQRWILVDAQVDDRQRDWFGIRFDVTDVPRDRFLTGGRAWAAYRSGAADPAAFGLTLTNEAGDWWIAANLMRDAAALRNTEVLPWDCWGEMPGPEDTITGELALLLDRLAALTENPDASHAELDRLCLDDERLRVPRAVRSGARDRDELLYPRSHIPVTGAGRSGVSRLSGRP
jgi:hypothetical protein